MRAVSNVVKAGLLVMVTGVMAACSSSDPTRPAAGSPGSFRERMNSMLFGGSSAPQATGASPVVGAAASVNCPPVDIRQGASTLMSNTSGAAASSATLRYQVTIGQTARECAVNGGMLAIKIGVHGRVILGPAGSPGTIEVPLRLALVREGIDPKTSWTKLAKVAVTLASGQPNAPFLHIEEDISVPMPPGDELDSYVIYVGFDPLGTKEAPKRPAKRRNG